MAPNDLLKKKIKVAKNKFDVFRQEEQVALGMIRQSGKRPLIATDTWTLQEAERWRTDVVKEIVGRVERIADPLLQDHKVRDLNDLINRLFKEKKMWENRIKDLGGPDYSKNATNDMQMGGVSVPGTKGYRYFGRAKYLDGVKELFEQAATMQEKVTPQELMQRVDADYYGYRDEDDGLLLNYESSLQEQSICAIDIDILMIKQEYHDVENELFDQDFITPPIVPDQDQFEQWLVEKRKRELAEKYLE